jgi:RNA polymerase sigma-70 factor (ECF subfamily)
LSADLHLVSKPAEKTFSDEECERLRGQLERAVHRVCPRWLADGSEDLVQAAMMKVMEIQRRSEEDREFKASYLWKVAHSALVDEIRRHRRRREAPLEDDGLDGGPATVSPGPDRRTAAREVARGIAECLARLVRPRRLAVVLYLQGHSVPEAAELLSWGNKRTENLVYRGLADLRECLDQKGMKP